MVFALIAIAGCENTQPVVDLSAIAGEWKQVDGERALTITPRTYDLAPYELLDSGEGWWVVQVERKGEKGTLRIKATDDGRMSVFTRDALLVQDMGGYKRVQ